jgi:hypothetical protein
VYIFQMLLRKGIMSLFSSIVGSLFVLVLTLMMLTLTFTLELYAQTQESDSNTPLSPYESGYEHGCDDSRTMDFSDRYINQPGKGPSFHTEEFMHGYDAGFNECFG